MLALIRNSARFVVLIHLFCLTALAGVVPVRVACVGDSITFGVGVKNRVQTYPARLERMLGGEYEVCNFGVSGATLLKKSNRPYVKQKAYQDALDYKPDVVVIKLGTNDSKRPGAGGAYSEDAPDNWANKDEFVADYKELIAAFRKANPAVKVYVCLPVPSYPGFGGISDKVIRDEVAPRIRQVAAETGATLIDCYTALSNKPALFPDTVHPNAEGARLVAATVYRALIGKEPQTQPEPVIQDFVHPGLLHSREDLERIRKAVASHDPSVSAAFELLRTHPQSQSNYVLSGPLEEIGRNPDKGNDAYDSDANAAYQCALMWCITGDIAYANKSKEILNAWARKLQTVSGQDAVLMAGLGAFKMVNAAELLRYTSADWSEDDAAVCEKSFHNVIYPVIKDFAPYANGNWDTASMKTMLAIGIFCEDRAMVERCLRYYQDGAGNGALTHYIVSPDGQCQESGRDMVHAQLGLGHLGDCCEVAWHQGLNLYGCADNRLLKGFEYAAQQNLGNQVAFVETLDQSGQYRYLTAAAAGTFRPIYEEAYGYYYDRAGLKMPFVKQVLKQMRPEGAGPGADHPGFGTLLFSHPAPVKKADSLKSVPAAPEGLVIHGSPSSNSLCWVGAVGAKFYTVKRSGSASGPYRNLAQVKETSYRDTQVEPGKMYYYTVTASNAQGESGELAENGVCAGLPAPWKQQDVGGIGQSAQVDFDGRVHTIRAAGNGLGETKDQMEFVYAPLQGDGGVAARFVPQVSSQSTTLGVMLRNGTAADEAGAALVLAPEKGKDGEAPAWSARLMVREAAGKAAHISGSAESLSNSVAVGGRLVNACWLRLERRNGVIQGWISADGKKWTQVGGDVPSSLAPKVLGGLSVASGVPGLATTVSFEKALVSNGSLLPPKEKKGRTL